MASKEYERVYGNEPDVQVHRRLGCELCGKTTGHTHRAPDCGSLTGEATATVVGSGPAIRISSSRITV